KSPDKAVQEWFRSEFPRIRLFEELGRPARDIWDFVATSLIDRFDHAILQPEKQAALDGFRYSPGMTAESFVAELKHLCLDVNPRMPDADIIERARGKLPSRMESLAITPSRTLQEFVKNIRGLLRDPEMNPSARTRATISSVSQAPQMVDNSVRANTTQVCDYCNRNNHHWKQCRDLQRDLDAGNTSRLISMMETRN
ncbi:unnamed protein product, partial [Allacma fusca]